MQQSRLKLAAYIKQKWLITRRASPTSAAEL